MYNIGDRRLVTLEEMLELIARVSETDVSVVHASENELAAGGLSGDDFILYRDYPHVLATDKLSALGRDSTPLEEVVRRTTTDHLESGRDRSEYDPGRDAEEAAIDAAQ